MSTPATLGNEQWVRAHTAQIKAILPETWTHVQNLNGMYIGFQLKLLGIEWRTQDEFSKCLIFFERVGIMQRNGLHVRRSP